MAFDVRSLSVIGHAYGFTYWHYQACGSLRAKRPLADILADGFFHDARDTLSTGHMILVSATDGGAMLYVASADTVKETDAVRVVVMARAAA